MGKSNNYTRGTKGHFTGSTGGRGGGLTGAHAGGGKTLGGVRGIVARSRLRQAQARLAEVKAQAARAKSPRSIAKLQKRIARADRSVAAHQREVKRVEKRGLLGVKSARVRAIQRDKQPKFTNREMLPGVTVRPRAERARGTGKVTIGQRIERIRGLYERQQRLTARRAFADTPSAAARSAARERKFEKMLSRLRAKQ